MKQNALCIALVQELWDKKWKELSSIRSAMPLHLQETHHCKIRSLRKGKSHPAINHQNLSLVFCFSYSICFWYLLNMSLSCFLTSLLSLLTSFLEGIPLYTLVRVSFSYSIAHIFSKVPFFLGIYLLSYFRLVPVRSLPLFALLFSCLLLHCHANIVQRVSRRCASRLNRASMRMGLVEWSHTGIWMQDETRKREGERERWI